MAQYREFMPGQVWFYYNPSATKPMEERYERGALTNRPVVIVQAACYPEWQDTVTVVPLTTSDRRSGIYIDTTVLRDGVRIDGGTILPYLMYTIKTKFLYAVHGGDGRRRIVSLSKEDYEKVRQGYLYHLGEIDEEPEYVKNWKHLDDIEKRNIEKEVRLFTDDFEDALDMNKSKNGSSYKYSKMTSDSPKGVPTPKKEDTVASSPITDTPKPKKKQSLLDFAILSTDEFKSVLDEEVHDLYEASSDFNRIYSDQKLLEGLTIKECVSVLEEKEYAFILNAPLSEIVELTGVGSTSSASRLRKEVMSIAGDVIPEIHYPEPFRFNGSIKTNNTRVRRNLNRRKFLFSLTKDEQIELSTLTLEEICAKYPRIARNIAKNLCVDIEYLYPHEVLPRFSSVKDDIASISTANTKRFDLYETLSPQEIADISRCDKRNIADVAKRYNISRDTARNLRSTCHSLSQRHSPIALPKLLPEQIEKTLIKLAERRYDQVTDEDLYIFCRCDPDQIIKVFHAAHNNACPSKDEIYSIKFDIRNRIVKRLMV